MLLVAGDDVASPGSGRSGGAGGEIQPDEKVATLGSCFAQHLSAHIRASGLRYFVAETAPAHLDEPQARALNYGVFSARYGNVYTVRQAVQLFDRAYGRFAPVDDVWAREDWFVDAFRPQIAPEGFGSRKRCARRRRTSAASARCLRNATGWCSRSA